MTVDDTTSSAADNGPSTMLRLEAITKSYGNKTVLHDVDLDVRQGETVCIIGPSGSGKSTLLRCANLLETPDSGTRTLADVVYFPLGRGAGPLRELRTRTAMVFQDFQLYPHSPRENIAMAPRWELVVAEARARADRPLERVGPSEFGDRKPGGPAAAREDRPPWRWSRGCWVR